MAQEKVNTNDPADEVSAQLAALKADIAKLTGAMAELGRAKGNEFQGYAKDKAAEARAKAHDGADYMKQNAEFAYGKANDFVAERPATSIGIAAALGFLIGHMTARK